MRRSPLTSPAPWNFPSPHPLSPTQKPLHLVLPPGYRDYWHALEDERKAHPRRSSEPPPADPFNQPNYEQRKKEKDLVRKQRERKREMDPKFQLPIVRMSDAARALVQVGVRKKLQSPFCLPLAPSHACSPPPTGGHPECPCLHETGSRLGRARL